VARWQLLYEEHQDVCLELSLQLGETLRFSGDSQGARLVLKDALLGAEHHPELNARLLRTLAWVHVDSGDSKQALDTMQRAVRSSILAGSPAVLNEMYIELGKLLARLGEWSRAAEELTEGVLLVTGGDGPEAENAPPSFWRLLGQLAEAMLELDRPAEAVDTAYAALRQAEREQTLIGQARCHYQLSQLLTRMSKEGPAEEHHTAAVAAFRRLGDRRSTAECLIAKAATRPHESAELVREALELATQVSWAEGIRAATRLGSPS
jgi:tetratricopeptide (TPR) repeat protein